MKLKYQCSCCEHFILNSAGYVRVISDKKSPEPKLVKICVACKDVFEDRQPLTALNKIKENEVKFYQG